MITSSVSNERVCLWIFIIVLIASTVASESTNASSVSCSSAQSLCGGSICYNPATQYCTELGVVIQCIAACGNQCYNPSIQQCFNGTVCLLSQQLCIVKYDPYVGSQYYTPSYECYDPTYQACFNNILCGSPSRTCNKQCLLFNQVCANNVTVCNTTNYYYYYQTDQFKLCNGKCYDSAAQKCASGIIQCINNCSGVCYNSSTQQCFNGTVCPLSQQLCIVKYDPYVGSQYYTPSYECYDPTYQACFNNILCGSPSRTCNKQCLLFNQVCANNVTVCNTTNYYYYYQTDQFKLCNGKCYDSAAQKCASGIIQCINNCSGVCYNSSTQQCFNGTVCALSQQLCIVKYDPYVGSQYYTPSYECYDPTYQACFNNILCGSPSRTCNKQCLLFNQVCANNVTVCNTTNYYYYYQTDQFKLCNGQCYDSATQLCVGGYAVNCIRDPLTQQCIQQSTYSSQFPNTTLISGMNSSTVTAPTPSASSTCCAVKECTKDADCCAQSTECQCFRASNQDYGSCLNPYEQPICAKGCPAQRQCKNDTDCCKCQCGQVTVTNTNGTLVARKQCVPR